VAAQVNRIQRPIDGIRAQAALERSTDRARVYGPDATLRTFDRLAECARAVLRAGHPVIVDAAFLRRAERDVLRAAAVSRKR